MKYTKKNEFDVTIETYNSIKAKLDKCEKILAKKRVFLAIDGFIDSLFSTVKSRKDLSNWTKFKTIEEFAERLMSMAGSSGNIELILKKETSGGFVPNNAKALSSIGIELYLLGAMGYPKIKQIYENLNSQQNIDITSIANPGKTFGLEFNDGKLMLSDLKSLYEIDWKLLTQRINKEEIIKQMENSDAVGFGYWSILPQMTSIWKQFTNQILPSIKTSDPKFFFVDLADTKKRQKSDIREMLEILQEINEKIPVLLSLNDQEAIDISKALDSVKPIEPNKKDFQDYISAGRQINKELHLSHLVIHSPHFATCTLDNVKNHYWVTEGFTANPSFTVSAGDHFNSGVLAGLLGDLSPSEAILMGNALTAVFVRTGNSPDFNMLKKFIQNYMAYIYDDIPTLL